MEKSLKQMCALTEEQKRAVEKAETALIEVYNSGVEICAFYDDFLGLALKCVNTKEIKPDYNEQLLIGDNAEEYVYKHDLEKFAGHINFCQDEDWLKIITKEEPECKPF